MAKINKPCGCCSILPSICSLHRWNDKIIVVGTMARYIDGRGGVMDTTIAEISFEEISSSNSSNSSESSDSEPIYDYDTVTIKNIDNGYDFRSGATYLGMDAQMRVWPQKDYFDIYNYSGNITTKPTLSRYEDETYTLHSPAVPGNNGYGYYTDFQSPYFRQTILPGSNIRYREIEQAKNELWPSVTTLSTSYTSWGSNILSVIERDGETYYFRSSHYINEPDAIAWRWDRSEITPIYAPTIGSSAWRFFARNVVIEGDDIMICGSFWLQPNDPGYGNIRWGCMRLDKSNNITPMYPMRTGTDGGRIIHQVFELDGRTIGFGYRSTSNFVWGDFIFEMIEDSDGTWDWEPLGDKLNLDNSIFYNNIIKLSDTRVIFAGQGVLAGNPRQLMKSKDGDVTAAAVAMWDIDEGLIPLGDNNAGFAQ